MVFVSLIVTIFQLYWNCTSAWVSSCNLAAYFLDTFLEEHIWRTTSGLRCPKKIAVDLNYLRSEGSFPLDAGHKLKVHKTFGGRPGRPLTINIKCNVFLLWFDRCIFKTGLCWVINTYKETLHRVKPFSRDDYVR